MLVRVITKTFKFKEYIKLYLIQPSQCTSKRVLNKQTKPKITQNTAIYKEITTWNFHLPLYTEFKTQWTLCNFFINVLHMCYVFAFRIRLELVSSEQQGFILDQFQIAEGTAFHKRGNNISHKNGIQGVQWGFGKYRPISNFFNCSHIKFHNFDQISQFQPNFTI